jgi:hypothetical protein
MADAFQPRTALLGSLELPLAPYWALLGLGEVPSVLVCIGGGVICMALMLDVAANWRE